MNQPEFKLDRTGFPMVWIEAINAYMHWIPVTKIQFEYFLCAVPDSQFDAKWYDDLLQRNPRVSPKNINAGNYWQAFLTGIMPTEAQRFARWCGDGYALPTLTEWFTAYQSLKGLPPVPGNVITSIEGLADRTKSLLSKLETAPVAALSRQKYERDRTYQMLMRQGVMEWVDCTGQRYQWGGMGEPVTKLGGGLFTPDHGQPSVPRNPDESRMREYGFRLIWRQE